MMKRHRRSSESRSDLHWRRDRRAGLRWALWGGLAGAVAGAVAFAPAHWLSMALNRATGERFQLADAQGTVWSGSAVAVLTGGPGSRDAAALPGRLHWSLTPKWSGLQLTVQHACCIEPAMPVELGLGWRRLSVELPARPQGFGQWPARWLVGLGTPWNTLQLGGTLRLSSPGLKVELGPEPARLAGSLEMQLLQASSRVSPIDPLGNYRLSLRGEGSPAGTAGLQLETMGGALLLTGSGQWSEAGLRFQGQARAAEGQEAGLSNLLNIIGRRQGALSVISIG